jgi:hypothetical protein
MLVGARTGTLTINSSSTASIIIIIANDDWTVVEELIDCI